MSHRLAQIAGIIRRIVASRALTVPPSIAAVVNITRVEVSPDLKYADVYVTALSGTPEAVGHLHRRRSEIRRDLGSELSSLHTIPSLRFHVDERSEELRRLDEIISRL